MLLRRMMQLQQTFSRSLTKPVQGPPARSRGLAKASKTAALAPEDNQAKNKAEALKKVMADLNKKHGKDSIMFASDMKPPGDCLKTGVLSLDIALAGGWPKGRIIEIYGPESSGKTTLALTAVKELQKRPDTRACLIDAEHAFDSRFCKKAGINLDTFMIVKPEWGEQAMDSLFQLTNSSAVDLIIVDSVAALIPKAELEGDMGAPTMGSQARLMSSSLRKIITAAEKTGTTIIFINQIRNKIGVMFGNPETTTGGKALLFYASVRIDLRKTKKLTRGTKQDADDYGIKVKAKVVKSKTSNPFKQAEFDILFDRGVDDVGSIFDAGIKTGVITARGAHYYVGEEKLGQGRDNTIADLRANTAKRDELEQKVRNSITDDTPETVLLQSDGISEFNEDGSLNEDFYPSGEEEEEEMLQA